MPMESILWRVLFGSIGLGYVIYGRRQQRAIPLCCGLGLMVLPYMVAGTFMIVLCGAVLVAMPFFVRV